TPVGVPAAVPLNLTVGVPTLKLAPVTVTLVLIGPKVGVFPKMIGWTTKLLKVCAGLLEVMMVIKPVEALVGTFAVIWLLESMLNVGAVTPLNMTLVVPIKFVPVITMFVPVRPLEGENPFRNAGP